MRNAYRLWAVPLLVALLAAIGCAAREAAPLDPVSPGERRAAVLSYEGTGPEAAAFYSEALEDPDALVRRAALRGIIALEEDGKGALAGASENADPVIRREAIRALAALLGADAVPYLGKAVSDESEFVRLTAVEELAAVEPRTEEAEKFLAEAQNDPDENVRLAAMSSLWAFRRDVESVRDRVDWDFDVAVAQFRRLPAEGWKFRTDPERVGHTKDWFSPEYDDSGWEEIAIEQAWQHANYDYIGVAWYRRWFELPERPEHLAAELHFMGVDESTWVWLNGAYAGDHDIGPSGWNLPFRLDVTDLVKWGEKNHIVVRVMNTAAAGGIWRPVQLEWLK